VGHKYIIIHIAGEVILL